MSYTPSRRTCLKTLFGGAGLIGLRTLVSGIPPAILLNPRRILARGKNLAAEATGKLLPPQFLVIATSDSGEPMNCNTPGMYEDPMMFHPMDAAMAPTSFMLGSKQVTAALPWSTLGQATLNRTCFFHHRTGSFQHGTMGAVNALQGVMTRNNMLISAVGNALQSRLDTLQGAPVTMVDGDSEFVTFEGRLQPNLSADSLKYILATAPGVEDTASLQKLRDRDVNAILALIKAEGNNAAQRALLDQWATSQTQARSLPADVINALGSINDNGTDSRLAAALALIRTKLTPVVNIKLRMGGDNHNDPNLAGESRSQTAMIASINKFLTAIATGGMANEVSFATLTNFGRSNTGGQPTGGQGRDHNGDHTCNVLIGSNFKGGVVGGATLKGKNQQAMDIDSTTGMGGAGGDIQGVDTLASFGLTLATGLGADTSDFLALMSGTPLRVKAALAS